MMRRVKGFSLLELVMVMALIAVVLLVLLPRWSAPGKGTMNATVHELVNALEECKLQAMASGKPQTFTWNPTSRQWHTATRQGNIPEPIEVSLIYAKQANPMGQEPTIEFSPNGRSTGARFSLRHEQQQRILDIDWLTAQVQVKVGTP